MTFAHLDSAILAALKAGERLTPAIAADRWRCMALHSAIARLREAGHNIVTTMRSENGRRFGEYRLSEIHALNSRSDARSHNERAEVGYVTNPDGGESRIKPSPTASAVPRPYAKDTANSQVSHTSGAVPPHKNCVLVTTWDAKGREFQYQACEADE